MTSIPPTAYRGGGLLLAWVEKRLAQNETKAKAMEQENIALKAQMKALTARLDALTATK